MLFCLLDYWLDCLLVCALACSLSCLLVYRESVLVWFISSTKSWSHYYDKSVIPSLFVFSFFFCGCLCYVISPIVFSLQPADHFSDHSPVLAFSWCHHIYGDNISPALRMALLPVIVFMSRLWCRSVSALLYFITLPTWGMFAVRTDRIISTKMQQKCLCKLCRQSLCWLHI